MRLALTALWGVRSVSVVVMALSLAVTALVRADASPLDQIVKSIAENVLGRDSVKAVRVSVDATAVVRWEGATYRPRNGTAISRELLYDEAGLVTGAILGSLRGIRGVSFTMARGGQVLATGDVSRSHTLVLRLAPRLGGGVYIKPHPGPMLHEPVGGATASSL